MSRSSVVIVSPARAEANNGNWRTAERWQNLLSQTFETRIVQDWPDARAGADTLMLALHARRSAVAVRRWSEAHPGHGLAVVLTGTDLYQDIQGDPQAQRSLELAQRLVVLQELGAQALPPAFRHKTRVVFQSTPACALLAKPALWLRALMVGHLRAVKSPQTLFEAARLLAGRDDIRIDHIGSADDTGLGELGGLGGLARATERDCPQYRWLDALPHPQTRRRIQRAHVLVHTSALEGGAHVIMEAVRSGTPVLASRVPGNVGMLGADYAGYFPHGDAAALAHLLMACRDSQNAQDPSPGLLGHLRAQCALRAPLFDADAERATLIHVLTELETRP